MGGLFDSRVGDALAGLASAADPAAAGAASALACATAAALVELTGGLAAQRLGAEGGGVGPAEAERLRGLAARAAELRARMPAIADADAGLYAEVARAPDAEARAAALSRASETPLEIAAAAAEIAAAASEVASAGRWPFTPDAIVAAELALAAARAGSELVVANLAGSAGDPRVAGARAAAMRAEAAAISARGESASHGEEDRPIGRE